MVQLLLYSISGNIIKLPIILKPQSKVNQVLGIVNGRLKIAISAPPVNGKANRSLIIFMSDLLSLKQREISIAHGLTSHLKTLHIPVTALTKLKIIINFPES